MTDKNYNKWLEIKNKVRKLMCVDVDDLKAYYPFTTLQDFTLMAEDKFNSLYLKTEPWGMYHPDQLHMWYDEKGTRLTYRGVEFSVTYNRFNLPTGGSIPNGIGIITSKGSFGYGVYEWRVKLPGGAGLWPAVWLAGKNVWPPEIDCFEGLSDSKGYGNKIGTNSWIGLADNPQNAGGIDSGFVLDEKEFFDLALEYEAGFIKIYYNGYLVRRITDSNVMKWFAGNPEMIVIMGTGIRAGERLDPTYPMIVERFIYSRNPNY